MAFFPTPLPPLDAVIRAQAAGQHVFAALFVTFAFKQGPLWVWEGDGPINRGGFDWIGLGQRVDGSGNPLQSIDGLEQAANGTAPQLSLTLNGVDSTVVTAAKSTDPEEIEGRELTVQIGFYDATMPGAPVPLDDLLTLGIWTMQKPSFTATDTADHHAALRDAVCAAQQGAVRDVDRSGPAAPLPRRPRLPIPAEAGRPRRGVAASLT
jgi:hypothetical protein